MQTASVNTAAAAFEPLLHKLFGGPAPVRFEFWDGSATGPPPGDGLGLIRLESADALRRILWSPGELGFARAFVVGDLTHEGDMATMLRALQGRVGPETKAGPAALRAAWQAINELGIPKSPLDTPAEEIVPRGIRHSLRRDRTAVRQHYDVGNDFYALVLGRSMSYSCARFAHDDTPLTEAQAAKHELICRKLGLAEPTFRAACSGHRPRLLDLGCGWGSMSIHAALEHDVDVVGVTLSSEQATLARRRVADAGAADRVDIRLQDYREVSDGPFDAISSIGMAEHVGHKRMNAYFSGAFDLLRPGGRMLNHAIASIGGSVQTSRSFIGRYVFPDGELVDMGLTVQLMQRAGFEVRDLENLREHYARTLRHWVANLEASWDDAVTLVGLRRARVWQLYMAGSINGFDDGGLQLGQILGVKPYAGGSSGMPPTRTDWG